MKTIHLVLLLAAALLLAVLVRPPEPRSTPAIAVSRAVEREAPEAVSSQETLAPLDGASSVSAAEFEAFDRWARTVAANDGLPSPEGLAEGRRLAGERRTVLKQLIRDDPEAALAAAVPWTLRNRLPAEIIERLEARISAPAEFSVLAAVPMPGEPLQGPAIHRTAIIDGTIYEVHVYGGREAVDSKRGLPIDGIAIDDQLAVRDASLRRAEEGEPLAAAPEPVISPEHGAGEEARVADVWISGGQPYTFCCASHASQMAADLAARELTPGPVLAATGGDGPTGAGGGEPETGDSSWTEGDKSLLVIRVDFPDLTGAPVDGSSTVIDAAYIDSRMDEVSDWIEEVSYSKGSMSLDPADVTGVLRMPQNAATYANGGLNTDLRLDAIDLAETAGFVTSNYDRIALVFSNLGTGTFPASQITYGGLGQIGASFTWYNGTFSLGVVAHEFGHNYGLRHANRWQIPGGSSNPVDPAGSSVEYGDVFDLMGSSPSSAATNPDHFNPWFLNRLDWLADSSIQTVGTSGTYRLHRYDHQSANQANTLAIKIDRSATENYWISYRRKYVGHPTRSDVSNGAYLVWGYDYQTTSNLIDVDTPGTNPNDASLNVGATFDDADAGIEFTVTAAGGSGVDEWIDVTVDFESRISFSQTSYDVDEASGNLAVVLNRSNNSSGPVSVTLSTGDGTATSPADFTATTTVVSWADGDDTPKTVNIPVVADAITEGSEDFTLTLSGISGGIILNESTVTASIREPGAADSGFAHGFFNSSASVRRIAVQPDGRLAFVGRASNVAGEAVNGIGRFESNGTLDSFFSTASSANITPVYAIARQPDGKIIVGGAFTAISGVTRNRIARLNDDGTLDTTFDAGSGPNGTVDDIALRPDGRMVIVGSFSSVAGTARRGIAQLLPDGSLDPGFLATPLANFTAFSPECVALQPDGKVLVGGLSYTGFDDLFDFFSSGILRLDDSGAIDMTFNIGSGAHTVDSTGQIRLVDAIAVQPDGKVMIGGSFTAFDGVAANHVARLNANGSVDTVFTTAIGGGADDDVRSIHVQGDGKILLGGRFSDFDGTARPRVARLLPSGAFDAAFDASVPETFGSGSSNYCYQVLMQPDTRILITLDEFGAGQTGVKRVFSAQAAPSGEVEFVAGSTVVNEGGTASLAVRRVGGGLGAISISYATIADTASTADFVSETGVLTWADGDTADKIITIDTTPDGTIEPDEFFSVQLGIPVGGTSLGAAATASVTIQDTIPLSPIETWRLANFGISTNTGDAADSEDPDFDGIANLIEYALGRSPGSGSGDDGPDGLPVGLIDSVDPLLVGRLVLSCDLPDPARSDVTYLVEVSETLATGSWTVLASKAGTSPWAWQAGGTARIVESSGGGRATVQVGDVELLSARPLRFMRLRVTRP